MRALGVDLGSRRIGIALSDSGGVVATPYEVIRRHGDRTRDHAELARMVAEVGAEIVVVGLPLSLDGSSGPAAKAMQDEAGELAARLPVPVVTHDERFTTVEAEHRLREAGIDGRGRRRVVDQVAAAVMLQAWLDSGAPAAYMTD